MTLTDNSTLDDVRRRMLRWLIVHSPAPEQLRPALAATYGTTAIEALPVGGTLGDLADAVIGVFDRQGFDPAFLVEWYRRVCKTWGELLAFAAGMGVCLGDNRAPETAGEAPRSSSPWPGWIPLLIIAAIVILVILGILAVLFVGHTLLRAQRA